MSRSAFQLSVVVIPALFLLSCERDQRSATPEDRAADDGDALPTVDDDSDAIDDDKGPPIPVVQPKASVEHVLAIDGELLNDEITAEVDAHASEIRDCEEAALQDPRGVDLTGAIVIRFVVGKDGEARDAVVELTEFGSRATESCLARVVEKFQLPPQTTESTVHLPFYMNRF